MELEIFFFFFPIFGLKQRDFREKKFFFCLVAREGLPTLHTPKVVRPLKKPFFMCIFPNFALKTGNVFRSESSSTTPLRQRVCMSICLSVCLSVCMYICNILTPLLSPPLPKNYKNYKNYKKWQKNDENDENDENYKKMTKITEMTKITNKQRDR